MNWAHSLSDRQQFGQGWSAEKTSRSSGVRQSGMAASSNPVNNVVHARFRSSAKLPELAGKTTRVIESVIERFGNSPEIAPVQKLSEPAKYLQRRTEFVGPHEASLSNSGPPMRPLTGAADSVQRSIY